MVQTRVDNIKMKNVFKKKLSHRELKNLPVAELIPST